MRRPDDYSPKEGARFEVHLEKARALVGEGALPFEAVVEPLASESRKPGTQWVARDLKPPIFNQAAELFASGSTVREVKELLGISHGEAGRLRLRAAADGLLEASGQEEMRRRLKSPLAGVWAELSVSRCPGPMAEILGQGRTPPQAALKKSPG